MNKVRLEAFSDAVLAIILTIMVLEMKAPHGADFESLMPLLPVFLSYILSFIYIGIYWNNHHHLMFTVKEVSGGILWANLHLLFWLSLIPFVTGWMGENNFAQFPVALYGVVLIMAAIAFTLLQREIMKKHGGRDSKLAKAIGSDLKGKMSPLIYLTAIISAYFSASFAGALYVLVALIWLVPDKRIEKVMSEEKE